MSPFRPIDYKPLDFGGLGDIANLMLAARKSRADIDLAKQNAETQASYARNAEKRLSAQEVRDQNKDKREAEALAHARGVETSNALLPTSPLMRAARKGGPAAGTALGRPYGVSFEEESPRPFEGPDINPATGSLLKAGAMAYGRTPGPGEVAEGPAENGTNDLTGPVPIPSREGELADADKQLSVRKLYAKFGSDRFEVPQGPTDVGLDDKYQQIFDNATALGADETKAYNLALAAKQKDDHEKSVASNVVTRIAGGRDIKDDFSLTVEQQLAEAEARRAQSEKNARIAANARIVGSSPEIKQGNLNARAMSEIQKKANSLTKGTEYTKLVASNQITEQMKTNLESELALAHQDAKVAMARFFRQAMPTEGEMRLLYSNLGGWVDKFAQLKAKVLSGDVSEAQLGQLQGVLGLIEQENELHKQRYTRKLKTALGPGSGFDNYPSEVEAVMGQSLETLGIDPATAGDLYETESAEPALGSFHAPAPQAKGTKRKQTRRQLAEEAMNDPEAPPEVKARAKAILDAEGGAQPKPKAKR